MYFDLNVPIPSNALAGTSSRQQPQSKKAKGKQPEAKAAQEVTFSPAQISKIEARIDLLVRCTFCLFLFERSIRHYTNQ